MIPRKKRNMTIGLGGEDVPDNDGSSSARYRTNNGTHTPKATANCAQYRQRRGGPSTNSYGGTGIQSNCGVGNLGSSVNVPLPEWRPVGASALETQGRQVLQHFDMPEPLDSAASDRRNEHRTLVQGQKRP